MNDQTPSDDIPNDNGHDGQSDFGPTVERRLRVHLGESAERITLADLEPSRVRRAARQRTIRRHRTMVGGVAAATVVGMLVGVQALSGGGSGLRTVEAPSNASDGTLDSTVVGRVPVVSSPAQLGGPAFVWKTIEAEQSQSIVSTFGGGGTQTFPGLAVSTSPGRSNDYDNITPSVWRTSDGVTWEQTDLGLPFGNNRLWESVASGGHLFALGTAPGIAATEPNPLQVAVAGIDSTEWTVSELPFDTNSLPELPFVVHGVEQQLGPVDGGVVVAVTPSANLNAVELAEASDVFGIEQLMQIGPDGVSVTSDSCNAGDYAPTSTVVLSATGSPISTVPPSASATTPDGASTASTEPVDTGPDRTAADSSECELAELTWHELGVPAESVAALRGSATTFFLVGADGTATPIESPTPGAHFSSVGNGTSAEFVTTDSFGNWAADGSMYRFTGGGWQTLPMTFSNWANPPLRLGGATVGFGYPNSDGANGPMFTTVGDDGSTSFVDTAPLFDEYSMVSVNSASVAAGHWVSAVSTTRDEIAAAGGLELTVDGLTVRQASMSRSPVFIDNATGAEIPESNLQYGNDDTITARNSAGDVIGTVSWDDIRRLSDPYESSTPPTAEWSIVATADGTTFARESVAELLGVEPTAIHYVSRMSSDGTQVVVVVTLNDRHPDDSRKQVTLVGTPVG